MEMYCSGRSPAVSTTSVSPSQRPTECPIHLRMPAGSGLPFRVNDPHVVRHLDQDHHRVRGLHDLVIAVVHDRQHRRSGSVAEREQATLAERPLLGSVVTATLGRAHQLLRLRSQRRHASLRRIDDQRAAMLAVDDRNLRAEIRPEHVVAADRLSGALLFVRIARRVRRLHALRHLAFHRDRLAFGQHELVAERRRALNRRERRVRPEALQVGLAIAGARRLVGSGPGRQAHEQKEHRTRASRTHRATILIGWYCQRHLKSVKGDQS